MLTYHILSNHIKPAREIAKTNLKRAIASRPLPLLNTLQQIVGAVSD